MQKLEMGCTIVHIAYLASTWRKQGANSLQWNLCISNESTFNFIIEITVPYAFSPSISIHMHDDIGLCMMNSYVIYQWVFQECNKTGATSASRMDMECVYVCLCLCVFSSPGPGYTGVSCFEPQHSSAPLFSLSPSKRQRQKRRESTWESLQFSIQMSALNHFHTPPLIIFGCLVQVETSFLPIHLFSHKILFDPGLFIGNLSLVQWIDELKFSYSAKCWFKLLSIYHLRPKQGFAQYTWVTQAVVAWIQVYV